MTLLLAVLLGYFPPPDSTGGWRIARPDSKQQAAKLAAAFEFARSSTKHGGLLVLHRGRLIYEKYFGLGAREATPNTASCGKAFTSIAVGILLDERKDLFPEGLDTRVFTPKYLPPAAFPLSDPRKAEIRLGQLLSMSAGIAGNNPGYVNGKPVTLESPGPDGWAAMIDATALGLPLWCDPGGGYSYATSSIHLASTMLRHVTGEELQAFLERRVAKPLGWGRWGFGYQRKEMTHTPGGGGIAIRATDMLRFGYLLLNEGRWRDRQVVPAAYVRACGRSSPFNPHYPYSLQFNVNTDGHLKGAPRDAFWKSGSGGHCIYVVPSMELVVWKIGGRDEQYDLKLTNVPPGPLPAYDGSREGFRTTVSPEQATERTLQLVVDALR